MIFMQGRNMYHFRDVSPAADRISAILAGALVQLKEIFIRHVTHNMVRRSKDIASAGSKSGYTRDRKSVV